MLGRVSVFGTMSNHIPAARYGNMIGDVVAQRVDEINKKHTEEKLEKPM